MTRRVHANADEGQPTDEPRDQSNRAPNGTGERRAVHRSHSGRLLDLREAELYSGISAWTLRDLIASGELPAVRPPHLRRLWLDRADLDKAIAEWKDRAKQVPAR